MPTNINNHTMETLLMFDLRRLVPIHLYVFAHSNTCPLHVTGGVLQAKEYVRRQNNSTTLLILSVSLSLSPFPSLSSLLLLSPLSLSLSLSLLHTHTSQTQQLHTHLVSYITMETNTVYTLAFASLIKPTQ